MGGGRDLHHHKSPSRVSRAPFGRRLRKSFSTCIMKLGTLLPSAKGSKETTDIWGQMTEG